MNYKHIMVAVDGSKTSYLALEEAVELTRALKATLRIIYVLDESVIRYTNQYIDFKTLWAMYHKDGEELLDKISYQLKDVDIKFETRLVVLKSTEGRLAEKIIAEATNWQTDLLVIGTHGRHGLSRFFLGSVAEKVVRISTMPVLLVKEREE